MQVAEEKGECIDSKFLDSFLAQDQLAAFVYYLGWSYVFR